MIHIHKSLLSEIGEKMVKQINKLNNGCFDCRISGPQREREKM